MGVINSLTGSVRVELTSADIAKSLCAINEMKIPISDLCTVSDLTVQFTVMRTHMRRIERIAQQKGDRLTIISRDGIFWVIHGMKQRMILLFGITAVVMLAMFLPGRVLFVEVEGNEETPDNLIIEAAQAVGIGFGDSRRAVRSEIMKNRLLRTVPGLQWAGVNTYGCRAVISVRERAAEGQKKEKITVGHVIASCDGVITSCVVTAGSGLCIPGQAVQRGQILISGYTDCGGIITAQCGQGEVFAQTRHQISAVTLVEKAIRDGLLSRKVHYSLCFGKKRINFFKGSGISDGSCVKMVTQYNLTLPGGFVLPVMLIKEEQILYQMKDHLVDVTKLAENLSRFTRGYIRENGVARIVAGAQETVGSENGLVILDGVYSCTEMIGRVQSVQIGDLHGKTD